MEIAPVLTELGTTVAVLAVFGWLLWKLFTPFIARLMDHLDKMNSGYVGYVEAQVDVASAMRELCQRFEETERESRQRDEAQDAILGDLVASQREMAGVLRGLQNQQQAHEGRAQKRHEQALAHADERHAELVAVLKALNGKSG